MAAGKILLGVIGRPHGVRGNVHVRSYAARPADLAGYGTLHDRAGRRFTLRWVADGVAEITEHTQAGATAITDRGAAERLTNLELFVDRAALPVPGDDEFYLSDLVGLATCDASGVPLGEVTAIYDFGAGVSLEIAGLGASTLVPFTRACVPTIDLAAGRLTLCLPDEVIVDGLDLQAAS